MGQFQFSGVNDAADFLAGPLDAFCIDITVNLQSPYKYDVINAAQHAPIAGQLNQIGLLFDNYYGTLGNDRDRSAAFQLALWSLVYPGGSANPFSYVAGNFNSNVNALFTTFTSNLTGTAAGLYDLFVLVPQGGTKNQTLLTARPAAVPEPGTLALLGLGLVGIGLRRGTGPGPGRLTT